MKYTGVFATEAETKTLKEIINTPVMMIFEPRSDARVECHKMALAHGLPEIPGMYGIVHKEFVSED